MNNPPKYLLKFLRWFCREEFLEEIEGDLWELYLLRLETSPAKAKRRFLIDVVKSLRWINLKKPWGVSSLNLFSNYLKISFRVLKKDYLFAGINVLGLSIALTIFILMAVLVNHEYSFDQFHTKGDRIYQVIQNFQQQDGPDPEIYTSSKLASALVDEISYVEDAVTINGAASNWISTSDKRFFEKDGIIASPSFFQIFDFELTKGKRNDILKNPWSIAISQSLAEKYFGFENPIGHTMHLELYGDFTITGVFNDLPGNSYIQFNFVISEDLDVFYENVADWYKPWYLSWEGNGATTYVLLQDDSFKASFESDIEGLLTKHLKQEPNDHFLINMLDLHFNSHGIDGRVNEYVKGDQQKVRLFVIIALVVLAMAAFNYINLTTARAIKRVKEVGVRKSIGAIQKDITIQFLVETLLLTIGSFVISTGLASVAIPYINSILDVHLDFNWLIIIGVLPQLGIGLLVITLLAGAYPALYLSKFSAIESLKNPMSPLRGNSILRSGLVTSQFFLVILFLSGFILVFQQFHFLTNQSIGFNTDQLLVIEINDGKVRDNYPTIKQQLSKVPNVLSVSGVTRVPGGYRSPSTVAMTKENQPDQLHTVHFYGIDANATETMELELVQGEFLSGIKKQDSSSVLINEEAARLFESNPVGQWISLARDDDSQLVKVVGILKNFHSRSLHEKIRPVIMGHYENPFMSLDDILVRVSGNDLIETVTAIEKIHNQYDQNKIMTWEFLDDMVNREYEKEMTFLKIFQAASVLTFLLAVVGIIGLVSYNILSRTKEFGIRKILGAKIYHLLFIHGKTFLKSMFVSILLAAPLFWYFGNTWLEDYAYKINLTAWPLLMVILGVMMAIGMIVSLLAIRSAKRNPAESLRYE